MSYNVFIHGRHYVVDRFFIPVQMSQRLTFLKKYFKVTDRLEIPTIYKRRKHHIEYADTALMLLGRIDTLYNNGALLAVGSCFLSDKPWAIIGRNQATNNDILHFTNIKDIYDYYKPRLDGNLTEEIFHLRCAAQVPYQLCNKYNMPPNTIVSIALNLLYDILMNCGPDCQELFDFFTNDIGDTPETVDLEIWEDTRCKVLGRLGAIAKKPLAVYIGQLRQPHVQLISTTTIEEVSTDNILDGEKTILHKCWLPAIIDDDDGDDGYFMLNPDRTKKYDHLCWPTNGGYGC